MYLVSSGRSRGLGWLEGLKPSERGGFYTSYSTASFMYEACTGETFLRAQNDSCYMCIFVFHTCQYINFIHSIHCFHTLNTLLSYTQYIAFIHSIRCFHTLNTLLSYTQYVAFIHSIHCFHTLNTLVWLGWVRFG